MFCSKTRSKLISRAHKRALRVVYQDFSSTHQELLERDGSIDSHQRNLKSLMCEVYKSLNHLNPSFLWDFFKHKETPYSLRKGPLLELPPAQERLFGIYKIEIRSTISWNNLPREIKCASSLHEFKKFLNTFLLNKLIMIIIKRHA